MNTNENFDIAILADDLTSAADGAAPFVARGHRAWIGRGRLPAHAVSVMAIDAGSRSLGEERAARRVEQLTRVLAARPLLYKTVDSTLRGHVKAELQACWQASGRSTLVFAPAFPAAGRTTVGGIQRVDGVPVADTAYGRDPVHPALHSDLASLVPACIKSALLLDASTQEQLDEQVAGLPSPETILWVGSPGLAMALARRFTPPAVARHGGILVAVGSANPCSHQQADAVARMPGVTLLRGPRERQPHPAAVLQGLADQAMQVLSTTHIGAIVATGGDTLQAILDRLDVGEFEVLKELEPGFALGRVLRADGSELLVAMKAGGFGDDQALCRAVKALRDHFPALGAVAKEPA
ncbi:Uncharacterized protein conserved in bacteria [Delftia tsuruhatensis]|uniref:four-carbon acid sugar kinase family protein n=1 Tax=Delftia tsuruhatensis TaxID=180282 RepID=UPI001E7A737F|nr:four-carbon acid sugar kinase family protein [Delftia tsuruhatensis]CAB5717307.1 Uncharacterized protein conserved in bacteria [Delftia tsuruhatensis]CAC9684115.1 Uncharacterized protein conserved in bacteria [Delftia tsuruhatensis]